jgi:hypothetical protein
MLLKSLEEHVCPHVGADATDDVGGNTLLGEINCHIRRAATGPLWHIVKHQQ